MITFVTDKDKNENNDEEPVVGVTQTGTPVGKIVEEAEKAALEKAEQAQKAKDSEESKESKTDESIENVEPKESVEKDEGTDEKTAEIENDEKSENSKLAEEKISEILDTFSIHENKTLFHKGNLRNGSDLEYDGSIVLLGDVNPGAQVKATGNILILGSLKGVAHAGSKGETDAFVFALNLIPVQLRIANIITRFPDGDSKEGRKPEYAYVEDGKIYVSTFV